ncbi:golgin subfamily A member 7B-like isoform X2 [Tubulanus polymorphus]
MDDLSRLHNCTKVFIQRDFSEGTQVRFQNKLPPELEGKIERAAFEYTMSQLNAMFEDAEKLSSRTYCESCLACMTAYLSYLCMDTYYEKCLKKISRFTQEQNNTVYVPRGLMVIDPVERGLRVVEICILNEPNR